MITLLVYILKGVTALHYSIFFSTSCTPLILVIYFVIYFVTHICHIFSYHLSHFLSTRINKKLFLGKADLVDVKNGTGLLYRTDFFPGLGWMLTRELWDELGPKWPRSYWDDWVRAPEQRSGRACIRPEISRTRTFGKKGVSK